MPIVGSFAGASARAYGLGAGGVVLGDFESIATTTLSGNQASVTFSGIPQTYTHLQLRVMARTTGQAEVNGFAHLELNGDTGSNYSWHYVSGNGASASSLAGANASPNYLMMVAYTTGQSASASIFGVGITDFLDYANTNKFKTVRCLAGMDNNSTAGRVYLSSTNWRNTNAITSIKIYPGEATNFVQYCSFALYGVKA
jgi:hypothetical protein